MSRNAGKTKMKDENVTQVHDEGRALERGKLLKKEKVYSGRIIDLEVDQIRINGRQFIREVVRHPGGVVILAEVEKDRIPFVRQHRYPMNRELLELPAGKLDAGEEPVISAARELEEETGFRPLDLKHVLSFYSSPGFCDELLYLFYTEEVIRTAPKLEFDEDLVVEFYSLSDAIEMVAHGEILDAKTTAALFWLAHRKAGC